MAYSSITNPRNFMNTVLYTGNGGTQSITGVGFQPDFTWMKCRSDATDHALQDIVRGNTRSLQSNSNGADADVANSQITAWTSDGFNLASGGDVNTNGRTYCSWNWKAGGGQGSSNTDGSINTIYTSVNTTSGCSISRFDGTGSAATVGHGLGAVPKMIIVKNLDSAEAWTVYHGANTSEPQTERLYLNATDATSDSASSWNDTAPTSTVFTVGASGETNANGAATIAYCFSEKVGYSKFNSYVGNGNADGAFIYTGFKPAFVMLKNTTRAASWLMYDNKRLGYNVDNNELVANTSAAEETYDQIDILSNGFKMRANGTSTNLNGDTYIFMAFAEEPFVASNFNVATAR